MSGKNAGQFVEAMKMDRDFRDQIIATRDTEDMKRLLGKMGYIFTEHELVAAMAACMAQMDNLPT